MTRPAIGGNGSVTVAWDADTEPDLAGYKIFVGKTSRFVTEFEYQVVFNTSNCIECFMVHLFFYSFNNRAANGGAGRHRAQAVFTLLKTVLLQYTCRDDGPLPTAEKGGYLQISGDLIQLPGQLAEKNMKSIGQPSRFEFLFFAHIQQGERLIGLYASDQFGGMNGWYAVVRTAADFPGRYRNIILYIF